MRRGRRWRPGPAGEERGEEEGREAEGGTERELYVESGLRRDTEGGVRGRERGKGKGDGGARLTEGGATERCGEEEARGRRRGKGISFGVAALGWAAF